MKQIVAVLDDSVLYLDDLMRVVAVDKGGKQVSGRIVFVQDGQATLIISSDTAGGVPVVVEIVDDETVGATWRVFTVLDAANEYVDALPDLRVREALIGETVSALHHGGIHTEALRSVARLVSGIADGSVTDVQWTTI